MGAGALFLGVDSPFFSTIVLFKNQLFPFVFDGFLKRRISGKNVEGSPRLLRVVFWPHLLARSAAAGFCFRRIALRPGGRGLVAAAGHVEREAAEAAHGFRLFCRRRLKKYKKIKQIPGRVASSCPWLSLKHPHPPLGRQGNGAPWRWSWLKRLLRQVLV